MSSPMRLGINTLFLVPGDVGGTETYLRETLLACLQEFPDLQYILFTNNENDALLRTLCAGHNNVAFDCLGFNAANRPLRIIFEQTRLPLAARKHRLDLLWSPGYTAPFFAPCPQVVTIHDLQYKSFPEDMSLLERITLDILVRGACRRCEAVLAISEFSRKEILRHGFAIAGRVHTTLLGVDKSFADRPPEAIRTPNMQELLPNPVQPFILCIAHTYPHKMVHLLVEAFNLAMHRLPHNLVLVGRARRGEHLVEQAVGASPDGTRIIRFKDGLSYKKLQLLYQSADMFVLPSVYEGFGLPVLEAMMAGTPVITTNEASLPEVAGGHAFCVKLNNAEALSEQIVQMHELGREEKSQIQKAAQAWAAAFTWSRSVQRMMEVFQFVVGREES